MPTNGMPACAPPRRPTPRPPAAPHGHDAVVSLHTLGECRIVVDRGAHATTFTPASGRLFTLTLLLAADAGRPVPRARLAAWLWPDLPTPAARHALRQTLYRLRRFGVTLDGDDAHVRLARGHVREPHAGYGMHAGPHAGRCLPDWEPEGDALADWVDRYRLTVESAARPTAVREPPPPAPPALPYVGREQLLSALLDQAAGARAGRGSAVVLAAQFGAGITRLLAEVAAAAPRLGLATVRASSPAALVRALLDRPGALGCAPATLHRLRRFATAPALPTGHAAVRHLGNAAAELARAVAAERPLVVALDARRATPAEHAFAATLARAADGARLLAVLAAAPAAPLGSLGTARVVAVPPLRPDEAGRLAVAAARARAATLSAADAAWCAAMADGRPGDVIALAQACAVRPGTRDLPNAPATHLHDRIAALRPRTREVGALCALLADALGDDPTADQVARALGRRRAAIDAALLELRRAGLHVTAPPHDELPPDGPERPAARQAARDAARVTGAALLAALHPAVGAALRDRAAGRGAERGAFR